MTTVASTRWSTTWERSGSVSTGSLAPADELPHHCPSPQSRTGPYGRPGRGRGHDRERRISERLLPADAGTIDDGTSKAAVVNLTKSLAQEFGPKGIHVNAVSPSPVSTDLWLGEHGVARTVGDATGVDADTARTRIVAGLGWVRHRTIYHTGGSRNVGRAPRFRSRRQRDRRQLHHRWWPHQDDMSQPPDVINTSKGTPLRARCPGSVRRPLAAS
jgi:hypothetical protein